jgi:gluconate kinase
MVGPANVDADREDIWLTLVHRANEQKRTKHPKQILGCFAMKEAT